MMKLLVFCFFLPLYSAVSIPATSPQVKWVGRTQADQQRVYFDWEGVQATVRITGSSYLLANIEDHCAGTSSLGGGSRWAVDLTSDSPSLVAAPSVPPVHRVATFFTGPWTSTYVLWSNVGGGCDPSCDLKDIIVTLTRITESRLSGCTLAGNLSVTSFSTDGQFVDPPASSTLKYLFIGDSISAGDLNVAAVPFAGSPLNVGPHMCGNNVANNDVTVSAGGWACRVLGADCHYIAWGGIRLGSPDQGWGMKQLYPFTFSSLGTNAYMPYSHSLFHPTAIVINLGTNDRPNPPALIWQKTYVEFVLSILDNYPTMKPHIFLGYGPMTKEYEGMVQNITKTLVDGGAKEVQAVDLSLPGGKGLSGCWGHPSASDNYEIGVDVIVPLLKSIQKSRNELSVQQN